MAWCVRSIVARLCSGKGDGGMKMQRWTKWLLGGMALCGLVCALVALRREGMERMPMPEKVLRCDALRDPLPTQQQVAGVMGLYLRGYAEQHVLALSPAQGTTDVCVINCDLKAIPAGYLLPSVRHLWLSSNAITGVPEQIQGCSSLVYLNLDRNRLRSLPSLAGLPLRWLRVNENQLQVLPALPATLERLYAANNCLTRVERLPAGVKEVELSYNPLEALPDDFGVGLERLDVAYTTLKKFPEDLSGWRTLRVLNVAGCPLSEEEKDRLEAAFDLNETTIIF